MDEDNVLRSAPTIKPLEEFEAKLKMTNAFCGTAKSYVQISSAALALPLLFTQAMFGKNTIGQGVHLQGAVFLYLAWGCFLLSIGFGLLYQWMSIRRVWDEFHDTFRTPEKSSKPGYRKAWWVISFAKFNLAWVWLGMTFNFYLGAILFTGFAASNLLWKPHSVTNFLH